jgi:hypothetical protein
LGLFWSLTREVPFDSQEVIPMQEKPQSDKTKKPKKPKKNKTKKTKK